MLLTSNCNVNNIVVTLYSKILFNVKTDNWQEKAINHISFMLTSFCPNQLQPWQYILSVPLGCGVEWSKASHNMFWFILLLFYTVFCFQWGLKNDISSRGVRVGFLNIKITHLESFVLLLFFSSPHSSVPWLSSMTSLINL